MTIMNPVGNPIVLSQFNNYDQPIVIITSANKNLSQHLVEAFINKGMNSERIVINSIPSDKIKINKDIVSIMLQFYSEDREPQYLKYRQPVYFVTGSSGEIYHSVPSVLMKNEINEHELDIPYVDISYRQTMIPFFIVDQIYSYGRIKYRSMTNTIHFAAENNSMSLSSLYQIEAVNHVKTGMCRLNLLTFKSPEGHIMNTLNSERYDLRYIINIHHNCSFLEEPCVHIPLWKNFTVVESCYANTTKPNSNKMIHPVMYQF